MTVEEYAKDINMKVEALLKKCEELGLQVTDKNDILDDDDIVTLDLTLNNNESMTDENNGIIEDENLLSEELESKFSFEDRAEELLGGSNLSHERAQKIKLKKKDNKSNLEEYKKEKKNLYKNKTKLQSNKSEHEEKVVLYKEGMTVKDLASSLNVSDDELVERLFKLLL